MSATEARKQLYELLDDVSQSHEPVPITGKRGNAALVSEDDWRAVQATLHLVSISGMREAILEGIATPADELEDEPVSVSWRLLYADAGCARTRASSPRLVSKPEGRRRCSMSFEQRPDAGVTAVTRSSSATLQGAFSRRITIQHHPRLPVSC